MMRCYELASALLALSALAGCATFSTRLGGRAILGGYALMDAPASDVPVGARWRQRYGPIGPATLPDNLITRRSFNSLTLSRAARCGLEIRLAEYLGLEPNSQAKLSATLSEISIVSVKHVAELGLQPGDMYLSDAMKASKITVTTSSDADVEVSTSLEQRGLRVSVSGSADGQETLTVEGVDLFFAYRVIRLGKNEREGPPLGRMLKHPRAPGW
jgi:hypothetical protein